MSISAPFIARPIATCLLALAVLLGGALGYNALPGWAAVEPLRRLMFDRAAAAPGRSVDRAREGVLRAMQIGDHDLGPLRLPRCALGGVADEDAHLASLRQKRVGYDGARVPGNTSDDEHDEPVFLPASALPATHVNV